MKLQSKYKADILYIRANEINFDLSKIYLKN